MIRNKTPGPACLKPEHAVERARDVLLKYVGMIKTIDRVVVALIVVQRAIHASHFQGIMLSNKLDSWEPSCLSLGLIRLDYSPRCLKKSHKTRLTGRVVPARIYHE